MEMLDGRHEPQSENIRGFRFLPVTARRRFVAGFCIAVCIAAVAFLGIVLESGSANSNLLARIDHPLPPLTVEDSGGAVDLNAHVSGTRCVIVFYSPSCTNCKKVLPALQPFPEKLRLILVNESLDRDDTEQPLLQNADHFCDRWRVLSRSFVAAALPAILFVDEAGILRDGIVGVHGRGFVQRKLKDFAVHSFDRPGINP